MPQMEIDQADACNNAITTDGLIKEFGQELIGSEEVLSELLKMGLKYGINESDLHNKFEAYMIKRAHESNEMQVEHVSITLKLVQDLEKELAHVKAAAKSDDECRAPRIAPWMLSDKTRIDTAMSSGIAFPAHFRRLMQHNINEGPLKVNILKENSEGVIPSFNGHLPIVHSKASECKPILINKSNFEDFKSLRYMDIDINKVSEYLCSRIGYMDILFSKGGVPGQYNNEDEIYVVGRLGCEALSNNFALNVRSFFLEIFDGTAIPHIMGLDLSFLSRCEERHSLFPGQIVALTGKLLGSNNIMVTRVFYPPLPMDNRRWNYSQMGARTPNILNTDITVLIASGPFTAADDLHYTFLNILAAKIEVNAPSVVILLGPFVDERHKLISSYCLDGDPYKLFSERISFALSRIQLAGSKLILIPEIHDMISEWVTMPQPPITTAPTVEASNRIREFLAISPNTLLYPNPSFVCLNNVFISLTSTDIIGHISKAEVTSTTHVGLRRVKSKYQNVPPSEFGKYYFHLLSQQSIYPLSPPKNLEVCVNFNDACRLELPFIPDVLIVPSSIMPPKIENVEDCLCINPGVACGNTNGVSGSFALIHIAPDNTPHTSSSSELLSRVKAHIKYI